MKIRTCAALLIAAMMLVLTGCGLHAVEERLSAAEETAQIQAEATESAVREAVLPQNPPAGCSVRPKRFRYADR